MKNAVLLLCCWGALAGDTLKAQPYLDLLNVRYSASPDAGVLNRTGRPVNLQYGNISVTLPLLFRNKTDGIILSPFLERWSLRLPAEHDLQQYNGLALPVSLLRHVGTRWNILATGIVRLNDTAKGKGAGQAGSAVIAGWKGSKDLTLKFGLYVNGEYFGLFVMPLAGIDWRIGDRDDLFGVLPGSLTWQHRLGARWKGGAAFRAQTNSYRRSGGSYTRFDENQLGAFLDLYLTDHVVLNGEFGHSLLRQVREHTPAPCTGCGPKYHDLNVSDNLYVKVSLAYRLSLRQ